MAFLIGTISVLAYAVANTDAPWLRIAAIDQTQADAELRTTAWTIALVACLVVLLGYLLWRRDRQRRELAAMQREQAMLVEKLRTLQLLDAITNGSSDMIYAKDAGGRYILFNRAAAAMVERPSEAVLGQDDSAIFAPSLAARMRNQDRQVLAGARLINLEEEIPLPGGARTVLTTKGLVCDDDGTVIGLFGVSRDITERKRQEEELNAVREAAARHAAAWRLDAVVDQGLAGVAEVDLDGHLLRVNDRYCEIAGQSRPTLLGGHLRDFTPPADWAQEQQLFDRLRRGEGSGILEKRYLRQDGGLTYAQVTFGLMRDASGQPTGFMGLVTDLTERKRSEQEVRELNAVLERKVEERTVEVRAAYAALRESEESLRFVLEGSRLGTWDWNLATGEIRRNDFYVKTLGQPCGDIQGADADQWLALIHPDDRTLVWRSIADNLTGRASLHEVDFRLSAADGGYRWVRERARVVTRDPEGRALRMSGIHEDITERKEAQERLRISGERYRRLVENLIDTVWTMDLDGTFSYVSPAVARLRGFTPDEVRQQALDAILTPASLAIAQEYIGRLKDNVRAGLPQEDFRAELEQRCKDGSIVWTDVTGCPLFQADGTLVEILGVSRDISERKRYETELRQARDAAEAASATKSEFLAMLAHELRNPLAPIRNAAHILGRSATGEGLVRWAQGIIEQQVSHLTRMVDDLLDVSRIDQGKVVLQLEDTDLAALARQVAECARPQIDAKGHLFELDLPSAPLWLRGDGVRLTQVLLNLIDNAVKYTPSQGRIRVSARPSEDAIEILVEDTGMGISADLLPHVFDLFRQGDRTLDRAQGGLGLGLSIVRSLVQAHGGRVVAESDGPGCGTRMRLWLPRSTVPPTARPERPAVDAPTVPRRILVVDDAEAVADSTALLLKLDGHPVQVARSGPEAIQVAAIFHPELVLLDIGLPGMDGYETARRLRAAPRGTELYLIAVSGYGDAQSQDLARAAGFDHYLVKPVEPWQLKQWLAGLTWPRPS
jgi:PAS domain S-box-containing protein